MICHAKTNYCLLRLKEMHFITNYPHEDILLNKRSELISKCRHENKNMLANIGNTGKVNNGSMDQCHVLCTDDNDVLCFLFLLLGYKKTM